MPSFKTHALLGGGVGLAAYCVKYAVNKSVTADASFDFLEAAKWTTVGAAAASIPDWLEPAISPNHRGFFHSWIVLLAVGWMIVRLTSKGLIMVPLLVVAGLGYASHLIADSCTPRRLPWV